MFSFATVPVMFVGLLALFAWCTVWSVAEFALSRTPAQRVSNGLHVVMSVVMLAMVPRETWAPLRDAVGFPILVGFFVLAAGWFGFLALRPAVPGRSAHRAHFVGHSIMFVAMAWHLQAMAVHSAMVGHPGGGHGQQAAGHAPTPGQVVAWVGVPLMASLLVMGVRHLLRAVAPSPRPEDRVAAPAHGVAAPLAMEAGCREPRRPGVLLRAHDALGAAMNLGMFWMSVGIMVPIAPWFALLQR